MNNKTIILYKSKYGSTKKYAEWLAEEISCKAYESSEAKKIALDGYDTVICGGGLYAGGISGVSSITGNWPLLENKNVIVFTVGVADPAKTNYQAIIDKNSNTGQKEKIKFFHLRGGINYKKLGPLHKCMMKLLISVLKKKKESELSDEDKIMLESYGGAPDFTDRASLQPIIDFLAGLEEKR